MSDTSWDINKYFWPKDRVDRWWAQCWDWESLKKRSCPHANFVGKTYSEYYDSPIIIPDPRPGKNHKPVRESDYWNSRSIETGGGVRWLTEFPKGSGKSWTPYHLPLFARDTLIPSPKYFGLERVRRFYQGEANADLMEQFRIWDKLIDAKKNQEWENWDLAALISGLKARMSSKFKGQHVRPEGIWQAPLSGIVIPPRAQMFLSDGDYEVDFSDALIADDVLFSNPTREHAGSLSLARFDNASFGCHANFANMEAGCFTFTRAWFGDWCTFQNAVTNGEFENTHFVGNAIFSCCTFKRRANFRNAVISSSFFNEALFECGADFSDAMFVDVAGFKNVRFQDSTNFDRAIFLNGISISSVMDISTTTTTVSLSEEKVFHPTAGNPLNTERSTDQKALCAFREISFKGAKFWGDANFSNRIFSLPADFTDAHFYGSAIFHDVVLHPGTKFTTSNEAFFPGPGGRPQVAADERVTRNQLQAVALEKWSAHRKELFAARDKAKWARRRFAVANLVPGSVRIRSTDDWTKRCYEFEQAYRCLKTLMQQQGARNEEHFFYTLEIKSRTKKLDVPFAEKLFARLYGFASNYGQSIARPFVGAIFFWPAFIAVLLYLLTWRFQPNIAWADSIGYTAHFVVRNIVPGLNLREVIQGCHQMYCYQSLYDQWINHFISDWWGTRTLFYVISTLYSAGSLSLWFLFALALRRRFQIG